VKDLKLLGTNSLFVAAIIFFEVNVAAIIITTALTLHLGTLPFSQK